jgi:hypothetical protein
MLKYFGGVYVILDYLNPFCMGCYISLFIATINSEELLNTLLPDKCSMMGSYSGSNVGSNTGSSGSNTYNVGSNTGSSGSNTYNVESNTNVYSDVEKARAEETRRKILESNRAINKNNSSILPAA